MFMRVVLSVALGLLLALIPACEAPPPPSSPQSSAPPMQAEVPEYLVGVVLDLSGSYEEKMLGGEGKAWKFFMGVISKMFLDRSDNNDRLVIAQISARPRAMLWEGSPASLRQEFGGAGGFKTFVRKHSDPSGSRVHDSIADMVDYVTNYPGVKEGKTKTAIFVLSDMEDNFPDSPGSERRLCASLKNYAAVKGVVGFYWVEHAFTAKWKGNLQQVGFKNPVVESGIVSNPTLPNFEQ